MLIDGLFVMAIGMGVVFIFLSVMIVVMNITAKVIALLNKYFPEQEPESEKTATSVLEQNDEIAVVIAAVRAFS